MNGIEIKIRYSVKRKNGYYFSYIFTLSEIERGLVIDWIKNNNIDYEDIYKDLFIGKKDITRTDEFPNGKEIYTGDILKGYMTKNFFGRNPKRRECLFIITHSNLSIGYNLSLVDNNVTKGGYRTYPYIKNCEIIGNIHQNPELVKE